MCDLCGISEAMVRCLLCANQTFCLACDDMYHRHPKRCKHARKAIGSAAAATPAANSAVHRPPLPPKGDVFGAPVGPVAPPRRNAAGSTMNLANGHGNAVGQSATLPRKPSATMSQQNPASGRPLPPTPVENRKSNYAEHQISTCMETNPCVDLLCRPPKADTRTECQPGLPVTERSLLPGPQDEHYIATSNARELHQQL